MQPGSSPTSTAVHADADAGAAEAGDGVCSSGNSGHISQVISSLGLHRAVWRHGLPELLDKPLPTVMQFCVQHSVLLMTATRVLHAGHAHKLCEC